MKRVAVAIAILLTTSSARADLHGDAERRYREGRERFAQWDFEGARLALLQAYTLEPMPKFLWDLALAEAKSDHTLDALKHFRAFFALPTSTDQDKRRAEKLIAEANSKTGHLRLVVPQGVTVSVDEQAVSVLDEIDVSVGPHTIRAVRGDRAEVKTVETAAGQTVTAQFALPEPPPTAPAPPPTAATLPAVPPPVVETRPPWAPTIVGAGATVALAAAATGMLIQSSSEHGRAAALRGQVGSCADNSRPNCAALQQAATSGARDQNVGVGLWIAAGAAAVGTVGVWFLWPRTSVSVGLQPTGVQLAGHF